MPSECIYFSKEKGASKEKIGLRRLMPPGILFAVQENAESSISFLNPKERELLKYILSNNIQEYRPIDLSKKLNVTNRTIINRTTTLAKNGFITPVLVKERITSYKLSDYSTVYKEDILYLL